MFDWIKTLLTGNQQADFLEPEIQTGTGTEFSAATQQAKWDSAMGGGQPKDRVQPISPDAARQVKADQARLGQIRGELGLSADPHPPSEGQIDANDSPFFKEGPITEESESPTTKDVSSVSPDEEPEMPTTEEESKDSPEDFNKKKGELDTELKNLAIMPSGTPFTISPDLLDWAQKTFGADAAAVEDVINFSQKLYQIQPTQRRIDSGHMLEYKDMIQSPLIKDNLEQICEHFQIQTLDDLQAFEKHDQATINKTLSFLKEQGSKRKILGTELFSSYAEAAKNPSLLGSIDKVKDTFPDFSYRIAQTADGKVLTDPYDAAARELYLISKNEQPDDLSDAYKDTLVRFLYENPEQLQDQNPDFSSYLTLASIEGKMAPIPDSLYTTSQESERVIQKPQSISAESTTQLIAEGDQSKMFAYVYHLTDSYRYPVDTAIRDENLPKVHNDTNAARQILEHINDPVLKGLATARVFDVLLDEKLGNIDSAEQLLAQIDNPHLRDSLGKELLVEQERRVTGKTKAEEIFAKVTSGSKERIEKALDDTVKGDAVLPENKELLEQKAREYAQTQGVSINIGLDTLTNLLHDSRKFLSSWETNSKEESYNVLREKLEKKLGIFASGTHRDPSPIYAAVYAPNGYDEYHGPGSSYGDAFVILDKERIKSRTTFSTDDSLDNDANVDPAYCNFTWEDAAYIKAAKDINGRQGKDYVEAQILGGVTVDDIASINIPLISPDGEPKPDADAIRARAEQLRQEFPNITFNLIEKMEDSKSEGREEHSFRLRGELEREHPDIEPLPPTPITSEAKKRLESWGMPESFINRLQELTSSMRYDLCPQKAERIAQNGGYIYETSVGEEEIVLPDFINNRDRLDGHCADIAAQFLNTLYTSGYMEELRLKMAETGQPRLNPCLVQGLSRTHFNNRRVGNHVWTGLLSEGAKLEDMVTIDPSFQEISNNSENGYQIMESEVGISGITDHPTAARCQVGSAEINASGFSVNYPSSVVLGNSSDGELVYSFSFIKDNLGKYHTFLLAQTKDGGSDNPNCFSGDDQVLFYKGHLLTPEQRSEMITVCKTLAGMNLIKDQGKAEEHIGKTATVRFGEAKT